MMKVKGHWPSASTDEPQVLALAELLQDARIGREDDALRAVTELAKTDAGRRNDFRPTPAMLCDMAKAVRRDRHQRERSAIPPGINPDGTWYDSSTGRLAEECDPVDGVPRPKYVASPEARETAVAQIRNALGGESKEFFANIDTPDVERPSGARSELGSYEYLLAHADSLTTESRRGGAADTEEEFVQYRWCFEPPPEWKTQATCGPWVNSQAQAMNDGKTWLAAANRRHR